MKESTTPWVILILNVLCVLIVFRSLIIYASLFKESPWYNGSGMQMMDILIIHTPLLVISGIIMHILNAPKENKIIPIVTALVLGLPIIFLNFNSIFIKAEFIACSIMLIINIISTVRIALITARIVMEKH